VNILPQANQPVQIGGDACRANPHPRSSNQARYSGPALKRIACGVRALWARLDVISAEMASALKQREQHYRLADALLDEFDDLAQRHFELTRTLWRAEQRLAEAAMREADAKNREVAPMGTGEVNDTITEAA
jgi:hypothetical protein